MVERNDIVQITNEAHHWFPCFVTVAEPKAWGCQGYALIPNNGDEPSKQAWIRLNHDDFEKVGRAVIVTPED